MVAATKSSSSHSRGLNVYLNIGHKPHLLTLARYISKRLCSLASALRLKGFWFHPLLSLRQPRLRRNNPQNSFKTPLKKKKKTFKATDKPLCVTGGQHRPEELSHCSCFPLVKQACAGYAWQMDISAVSFIQMLEWWINYICQKQKIPSQKQFQTSRKEVKKCFKNFTILHSTLKIVQ